MESRDLLQLANEINHFHRLAESGVRSTLASAIEAGKRLLKAKAGVKHGGWLPWLKVRVEPGVRTCQVYMRVARNSEELEAQTAAHLGIFDALEFLAESADEDGDEDLDDDVQAAIIASEEEEELERETARETSEARSDASNKWERKTRTLANLASYFCEDEHEPTAAERERLRTSVLRLAHWLGVPIVEEAPAA